MGDALGAEDRAQLVEWMSGNATGDALVRAGVPGGWGVADKSGAAAYGTRNDIAVLQPPDGAPVVVAVLFVLTIGVGLLMNVSMRRFTF